MKTSFLIKAAAPLLGFAALCFSPHAGAERLVILHTNDTHSTIEPLADGSGGILQRKAVIDSIRNAEKNVILIDAGDVVQGSLFFKYFRGEVEYPLMDMAGYDIRILGNHEFDNGMDALAEKYRLVRSERLASNYDFSGTPLEDVFSPYAIREVGGKKIGFIGLNIDPSSLISDKCIDVNFLDVIPVANELAASLKNDMGCDLVVAVTHIGYSSGNGKTSDVDLARASSDIDIIIGGHSHTLVDPNRPEEYPSLIGNAEGKSVRVVQAGKYGKYLGKITVDLENLEGADGSDYVYELIPVTDRFPAETLDRTMTDFLQPYREKVDSVNRHVIARSLHDLSNSDRNGGLANLTADFGLWYGRHKADSLRSAGMEIPPVAFSVMNVGGIRHSMPKGDVTEGQILSTYPFSNRFVIVGVSGADIIEALRVAARKGGEAVSGNVRVVTDGGGKLLRVVVDGEEIDPDKEYVVATIDYVAEGNDDMVSMARHRPIWEDDTEVSAPILGWFKRQTSLGLPVAPDLNGRFVTEVNISQ